MTDRLQCTPDNPFTKERGAANPGRYWAHPDDAIHEVGEQRDGWPSGDIVTMKCAICGVEWDKELPQ